MRRQFEFLAMQKVLVFILFFGPSFPVLVQLDRVHPGMTEQAFAVALPEATRDWSS